MIRAAIIGAAGLSGLELMHILSRHPEVELRAVTSGRHAGRAVGEAFPELDHVGLEFTEHAAPLHGVDVTFLAIPNQASLDTAPRLLQQGIRVVDLSGVFRLRDTQAFERFYRLEHSAPEALEAAVFGLPEAYRERIPAARLVANPGCYPTGALLGLLPLGELTARLAAPPVIDAKSGVSGAGGRVENDSMSFMAVNENFRAYKPFVHQHTPEIQQVLADETAYDPARQGDVVFVPHLLPIARGIFCSIHLRFDRPVARGAMWTAFADYAARERFVKLLPDGQMAELRMVQHTNDCVVSLHPDASGTHWMVATVIDNLVKGAAGQAVQNMNLMFGLDEAAALA